MKKVINFMLKYKVCFVSFFIILAVFSALLIPKVEINYDLSSYLDSKTETSQALEIINEEFQENGNILIMVDNISQDYAKDLKNEIKEIDYVINVSFDENDSYYYHDDKALFVILIDGNDYSENATSVSSQVKELVESKYSDVYYGGTSIEKQRLKEGIVSQMPIIFSVSIVLVIIILLFTSTSWIEPLILLVCSGLSIVINLGTNIIFGEISYITNSVGAILQLALSIDYSIVLLNAYRKNKSEGKNDTDAMNKAIRTCLHPISASALTTIFGLLALLFMSFRIGFDIGIVLMKGIVISMISSLILLPCTILLFDRLMEKTKKRTIRLIGKKLSDFSKKFNKVVVPVTLALFVIGGSINFTCNSYSFNDSSSSDKEIIDNFSYNNVICLVYKNREDYLEVENSFINDISEYKTSDGKNVLKDYTALSNTSKETLDKNKVKDKLKISENESELLLGLYQLNQDPNLVNLDSTSFLEEAVYLINSDSDAKEFLDQQTKETIDILDAINTLKNGSYTSEEFYEKINSYPLNLLDSSLSKEEINMIYSAYFYQDMDDKKVAFIDMLNFLIDNANSQYLEGKISQTQLSQLIQLSSAISSLEQELTKDEFNYYLTNNYGITLSSVQLDYLYYNYYISINEDVKDVAPLIHLLKFMADNSLIEDPAVISQITNYYNLVLASKKPVISSEFIPTLQSIVFSLTGENIEIELSNGEIELLYILYLNELDYFTENEINGEELVSYISMNIENKTDLASFINQNNQDNINDLMKVISFLNDEKKYNYITMHQEIIALKNSLTTEIGDSIDEDKISGVYLKYALNNNVDIIEEVEAEKLVYFVDENKNTNSLLKQKLDRDQLANLDEAIEDLQIANDLLIGDNYSRLIMTFDLANESEESTKFINYLNNKVDEYFSDEAHIAGEIVSTYDLSNSFEKDQIIITTVSIVSVLVIILLVFKSLSLPLLLVLIIEGAILISFATNAITNNTFFMSYIIANSILMGATIDYGILMGSTYIAKRKRLSKEDSLDQAIDVALPTVFTSGSILTICGFVIFLLAKQKSISTVGLLIGKGTIASCLLVLISLPSFLYLLDKFLIKFTYTKNRKN